MPLSSVKRKRFNDEESQEDNEAKLRRKLHQALREIRKAVKKAKTFEVRKTVKRLKDARRKDPESDVSKGLGDQMEILKHLNYDQLARSVLVTRLKKDRTFSADTRIHAISEELVSNQVSPGALGAPTAKVQSRILSSKVLASEVTLIVETLRTLLHPYVRSEGTDEAIDDTPVSKKMRRGTAHVKGPDLSKGITVDPSDQGSDEGFENTDGDEAVAEVDDGWESGTVGAPSESDDSAVEVTGNHDSSGSEDSSEGNFLEESANPERKTSRRRVLKVESEFLPSLSTGFARGDSGNEWSDEETTLADGIKRNRRGQRARRAIWEKKFGKNANHVKKRSEQDAERRQSGSIPIDRRSAKGKRTEPRTPIRCRVTYDLQARWKPGLEGTEEGRTSWTGEQTDQTGWGGDVRGKQEEGPLHPSWEAKRKQKSASIVRSQGTKIVFSES